MLTPVKRKSRVITEVEQREGAFFLSAEAGVLRIEPQNGKIIRVSFSETGIFSKEQGQEYRLSEPPVKEPGTLAVNEHEIRIETSDLVINVNRETGSIIYCRRTKNHSYAENCAEPCENILLRTAARDSIDVNAYPVFKTIVNEHSEIRSVETADGIKKEILSAKQEYRKTLYHTKLFFEFDKNEALYGLGQNGGGSLNLRHTTQYLHQANLKIAIPFLVSPKGYGILLTTQGCAVFHDSDDGTYFYTEADEMADYFFIAGDGLDEVVKGFRSLTGKAVMLPRWAFGYIQSQERYESEQEILDTAAEFRKREIGLDAIVLDWFSWNDNMWGSKVRDQKRFPTPDKMMKTLHEEDVHFMLSIWPNMTEESEDYQEMNAAGEILPGTTLYNPFDQKGREIYWKQAYEGWYRFGTDAWWCDSSEAITPEWNREKCPQDFENYQAFVTEAAKIMPTEKANAYALYHARGIYEGQRKVNDGKRVLNLTRSGYPGSQKYGTVLWSGDTSASYEELRRQIIKGLNFCASGMPYWTMDIGAFFIKQGAQWYWNGQYEKANLDPAYRELYCRWFQFGAFLPMFRSHGTDCHREPWNFGEPGEEVYDALMDAIRLRYRLMPYFYSLAAAVWREDKSILRLLAFDFPEDEKACAIEDEFLCGSALLAAPVTEPMTKSENGEKTGSRTVYLPEGCDWFDYVTKERYRGGQELTVPLTMARIPLYVRAGSVLPVVEEQISSTEELDGKAITLEAYPGADGEFFLYEDAGDGYGYEHGEYALTHITYNDTTGKVELDTTGDLRFRKGDFKLRRFA